MMPGETVTSGATSHKDDTKVSEFKVMKSSAGWYIGTTYMEDYGEVPNTRETGYFSTEQKAIDALCTYQVQGYLVNAR